MSTKRSENLDDEQHFRLRDLLRYNLKSVRAYLLKEAFQQRTGTLLASCPSPNLPTISSDEPNRKPHFLWWSSRAEALGYKTRKSPGCSCRALLFEVLTAWHWDTLGRLHRRVSHPPTRLPRRRHGLLSSLESEKPAGKHRENIGREDRGALQQRDAWDR
jgi:hypothetical protein